MAKHAAQSCPREQPKLRKMQPLEHKELVKAFGQQQRQLQTLGVEVSFWFLKPHGYASDAKELAEWK